MKNQILILSISIGLLCFTACKNKNSASSGKVFRYNMGAGITSLDPAFSKDQATMWADNQIFNGLVQVNDQLEVQPCIAKSWEISADAKQYTFHLRDDVFFHDDEEFKDEKGRKVVATDFVYSLNRLMDSAVASPGGWLFNGKIGKENGFFALNDSTFQINLEVPFRPLMGLLTLQYCSVVPKEVVEKYGKDFRNHPVGTGPFKFKVWEENNYLILVKNENYFESVDGKKLPLIDGIKVSFINDKATEFEQFAAGKLDFFTGIDPSIKDKIFTKNGDITEQYKDNFNFEKGPYLNTEYLGFSQKDHKNKALTNKFVRQAINYGIDRQKLITYLRNNIGKPANAGIVPFGLPGFDPLKVNGYSYNPTKTKELLIKAGYPNGKGLGEIKLFMNPTYIDLCTAIKKDLEQFGIIITLENVPPAFLRESMRNNTAGFFRGSWIGDYPDAENYLALFYGGYEAPPNYTFFKNAQYDKLYEQLISMPDISKANEIIHQMENIILDEAPIVPLYYDEVARFTSKRVKNIPLNAMNLLVLKSVELD